LKFLELEGQLQIAETSAGVTESPGMGRSIGESGWKVGQPGWQQQLDPGQQHYQKRI